MRYEKPARSLESQIDLLRERGLDVPDELYANRWLKHVSYYRLSAYMLPFKVPETDTYTPGTNFEQITKLYRFDRRLRLILLEALEIIEVGLRACLTYELAIAKGPFAHSDPATFAKHFDHPAMMDEITRMERDTKETFVAHFRSKYFSEPQIPIWMATELLSFGLLSRMYGAAPLAVKKKFASRLDAADTYVHSWLHSLSYVRNVCAHHSRLWNRVLAIKPRLPKTSRSWPYAGLTNERLYCVLVITKHCLARIFPRTRWHERLFALFDENPQIPLAEMQIPANWREIPPWV